MISGLMNPTNCTRNSILPVLESLVMSIVESMRVFKNLDTDVLAFSDREELDNLLDVLNYLETILDIYELLDDTNVEIFTKAQDVIKKFYTLYNLKTSEVNISEKEVKLIEKKISTIDIDEVFFELREFLLNYLEFETLFNKVFFHTYILCWVETVCKKYNKFEVYEKLKALFNNYQHYYIGYVDKDINLNIAEKEEDVVKKLSVFDIEFMTFRQYTNLNFLRYKKRTFLICFTNVEDKTKINFKNKDKISIEVKLIGESLSGIFFTYKK